MGTPQWSQTRFRRATIRCRTKQFDGRFALYDHLPERNGAAAQAARRVSEELDLVGDDLGVVIGAPFLLVAGVADLASDDQLVALLLVIGD